MADFSAIPTHILRQDLAETLDDIIVCKAAIAFGTFKYGDGESVHRRLDVNWMIKQAIEAELQRRDGGDSIAAGREEKE
jgi:hypothetical protein